MDPVAIVASLTAAGFLFTFGIVLIAYPRNVQNYWVARCNRHLTAPAWNPFLSHIRGPGTILELRILGCIALALTALFLYAIVQAL
jgi:hypothetical protein